MEIGSTGRPTFGGLATGLDTNALLEGLLSLERQPLSRLQSRREEIDSQRGLMRELNTKLLTLREAAQALDNRSPAGTNASITEEFLKYEGSTSNEDVVTVSAKSGAAPGDIDVLVEELARGSRRFSTPFQTTPPTPALTSGESVTIDLNNADPTAVPPVTATSITINATADMTLSELRDQINTDTNNAGTVRADLLQISSTQQQLVITSTGTGVQNQLTITGDLSLEPKDPVTPTNPVSADDAVDAKIQLFGKTVTRGSNLIDDVLTGVTLKLVNIAELDANSAPKKETVTVGLDVDAVAEALETFTKAYNDVTSFIDKQFQYNETTKTAGPLSGDSTLRRIQSQLRNLVSTGYSFSTNPSNPFAPISGNSRGGAISNIGIEIESGGTLKINREKLEEVLAQDARSVREFLGGRARNIADPSDPSGTDFYDEGFAQDLALSLEQIVRTGDGALAERDKAFAKRLSNFDDSIERFERRLSQREETLIARFSSLESIVAGLQSQQGFLSSLS